ncbi:unnamed protein product [Cochlearia groenlandica]
MSNNRDKHISSGSGSSSGDNRRMYDCDICMRGFTNPQALGGHRNLHRRERNTNPSSSSFSSSSSSSHFFPFTIPPPPRPLSSSSLNHTNPNPPPYFPTNNVEPYNHHQGFQTPFNPRYNTHGASSSRGGREGYAQGEFLGLDLNLGLGSMNNDTHRRLPPDDDGGSQAPDDDDVDLDLRLGGKHRY